MKLKPFCEAKGVKKLKKIFFLAQVFFLTVVFGLFHGLIFLPVVLSMMQCQTEEGKKKAVKEGAKAEGVKNSPKEKEVSL